MKTLTQCCWIALWLVVPVHAGNYVVSVSGDQMMLNQTPLKVIGLTVSNALISDAKVEELIGQLDHFKSYGVNTVSVYFMGSRFGDVKGYRPDASLDPVYADRMARIIEAADQRGMVVLVGCLYWHTSRAKDDLKHWKQQDANKAVANTVKWLQAHSYRNVFVDPDNEGMSPFSIAEMIAAGHAADPKCVLGFNERSAPPPNADLYLHHSAKVAGKPWIQTEGDPPVSGGYWGKFSKESHETTGYYNYSRIGRYTSEMKLGQIRTARNDIDQHNGYVLASTWLQCAPFEGVDGPFHMPGGRSNITDVDHDIDTLHGDAGILWWLEAMRAAYGDWVPPARVATNTYLAFIDTSFENASPVWYEVTADGTIRIHLLYDHERSSPNRAAGHIHFQLHATPGARLTLEFTNLENVWNGRPGSVARELKAVVVSENGRDWKSLPTQALPTNRVQLALEMPGPRLYVARLEPYRLSDLDRLLARIRQNPLVAITPIGSTVQGRELEIVRIGTPQAAHRVFLRARAHPWESGGNWVVEGLIDRLLKDDAEARKYLERYCVYIMPLANKDGVARGLTRFNALGMDLNRNWDQPADPRLAPENAALEKWLESMIQAGRRPHLALELHNDGGGLLHISRPAVPELESYLSRMAMLEELLRKHTWFTEGSTTAAFRNPGSLGSGWLERFGIDAVVHEFNCHWIAGLKDYPSARHWRAYGEQLAEVFHEYFSPGKP